MHFKNYMRRLKNSNNKYKSENKWQENIIEALNNGNGSLKSKLEYMENVSKNTCMRIRNVFKIVKTVQDKWKESNIS